MKRRQVNERIWVQQILDRYEEVESLQPHATQLGKTLDDSPPWVLALWKILIGVSHPGIASDKAKSWTAKNLGLFLGRQSALEGIIWDEVPLSPRVEHEKKTWLKHQPKLIESCPELKPIYECNTPAMEKWRPVFRRFIDEAIAEARQRPYNQASAFLLAFAKGNHIGPDDLATERTMGVGEKLAFVMIHFWKIIEKFQSVAELHRFLEAAAKPHGVIITLKRVEKLCQRIGLKFKGRGRPKKIQTNSTAVA